MTVSSDPQPHTWLSILITRDFVTSADHQPIISQIKDNRCEKEATDILERMNVGNLEGACFIWLDGWV